MVVPMLEVCRTIVAVVLVMPAFVTVAVAVAARVVPFPAVMVVMARAVPIMLRGRRSGDQHERDGDQACKTRLHRIEPSGSRMRET